MVNPSVRALLNTIGNVEAGKRQYNAIYLPAERKLGEQTLSTMTVHEVQALQQRMVKVSASSAVGRYQFIRATLAGLILETKLSGKERFNEALQDRLALRLLERRGLSRFLAGTLSREDFANNLAKEWASLPVVTPINGKKIGQSYYAGDGLNHAYIKPETILGVLDALKAPQKPVEPSKPVPPVVVPQKSVPPVSEPEKPKKPLTKWQAFWLSVTGATAGASAWIADNAELVMGGLAVAVVGAVGFVFWRSRKNVK